ncbi:MAG: hypothetical protein Q4G03_06635 [Planctomycetia bacterium]|nr:hypothetical protein [Planctomycetia bacterium]
MPTHFGLFQRLGSLLSRLGLMSYTNASRAVEGRALSTLHLCTERLEERQLLSASPTCPQTSDSSADVACYVSQTTTCEEALSESVVAYLRSSPLFQASCGESSITSQSNNTSSVEQLNFESVEELVAQSTYTSSEIVYEYESFDDDVDPELPSELIADASDFEDFAVVMAEISDELSLFGHGSIAGLNSGGGEGVAPYFTSGGAQATGHADYVLSADSGTVNRSAAWFINPDPSSSLTYSVQSNLSFLSVSVNATTGALSMTPTGSVGVGTFTVTATNDVGSCSVDVSVYCGRVIGYTVEERVYGGDWGAVDDSGTDASGKPWNLLWRENEYRWTPVFEANLAPPSYKVAGVDLWSRTLGSTSSYDHFASGSFALGYSGGSIEPPAPSWPCAEGVPWQYGEQEITVYVTLNGYYPSTSTDVCLDANSTTLTLNPAREPNQCPRIGVNQIASVTWTPPNDSTVLENDPQNSGGLRFFPERPSENADVQNQMQITVTLMAALPTGMSCSVNVHYFDPVNKIGTQSGLPTNDLGEQIQTAGRRDNNGNATLSAMTLILTGSTENTLTSVLTVTQANAGDNYIAVAHPNNVIVDSYKIEDDITSEYYTSTMYRQDSSSESGYSLLSSNLQSSVLTVWRTLWVESARALLEPLYIVSATEPDLEGIVASEFARACIKVEQYPSESSITVHTPEYIDTTHGVAGLTQYTASRTAPAGSSTYWTCFMLGAFFSTESYRGVSFGDSSIIFNSEIESEVIASNEDFPTVQLSVSLARQRTCLHELGHLFGLEHEAQGVMLTADEELYQTIPITYLLYPSNIQFTIDNLRQIQTIVQPGTV